MTKSKFLVAAAALSLTTGALLPHTAQALTLGDVLRGGQARSESIEVASAKLLDDNGNSINDSQSDNDGGAGHDNGESNDHGDNGGDHGGNGGESGGDHGGEGSESGGDSDGN